MVEQVFELQISASLWESYEEEIPQWAATVIEFTNWEYGRIAFLKPEPIVNIPDRIVFNTSYKILTEIDFIPNNAGWPIVSKKMLNTLLSKLYPVVLCIALTFFLHTPFFPSSCKDASFYNISLSAKSLLNLVFYAIV